MGLFFLAGPAATLRYRGYYGTLQRSTTLSPFSPDAEHWLLHQVFSRHPILGVETSIYRAVLPRSSGVVVALVPVVYHSIRHLPPIVHQHDSVVD